MVTVFVPNFQNAILKTEKEEKETIVAASSRELDDARAECQRIRKDLELKEDEVRQYKRQIEDLAFGKSFWQLFGNHINGIIELTNRE